MTQSEELQSIGLCRAPCFKRRFDFDRKKGGSDRGGRLPMQAFRIGFSILCSLCEHPERLESCFFAKIRFDWVGERTSMPDACAARLLFARQWCSKSPPRCLGGRWGSAEECVAIILHGDKQFQFMSDFCTSAGPSCEESTPTNEASNKK